MLKKSMISFICYLFILNFATKFLSTSSRIILNRSLGLEVVRLFSLVNPFFIFSLNLTSFSLNQAIAILISKYPSKAKSTFFSALKIALLINSIFIIFILISAKFISHNLLKNEDTYILILSSIISIPLSIFSQFIKAYFLGRNFLEKTTLSSFIEEASRLIFSLILIPHFLFLKTDIKALLFFIVLILGEIVQSSYLLLSSLGITIKNIPKFRDFFKFNKEEFKEVFKLSYNISFNKIITSFIYMIEPIIIINLLTYFNYEGDYILNNYALINSYFLPLIFLPNFFSNALSNYLMVILSSTIGKGYYQKAKNIFYKFLFISLIFGIISSLILYFFGEDIIFILYRKKLDLALFKHFSLLFIPIYLEGIIISTMNTLNKSHISLKINILSNFFRLLILIICIKKYGIYALIFSILISIYINVFSNLHQINKSFILNNKSFIN